MADSNQELIKRTEQNKPKKRRRKNTSVHSCLHKFQFFVHTHAHLDTTTIAYKLANSNFAVCVCVLQEKMSSLMPSPIVSSSRLFIECECLYFFQMEICLLTILIRFCGFSHLNVYMLVYECARGARINPIQLLMGFSFHYGHIFMCAMLFIRNFL